MSRRWRRASSPVAGGGGSPQAVPLKGIVSVGPIVPTTVMTYNSNGTQTTPTITFPQTLIPTGGIAVDAAGKIYVTNDRVGDSVTTYNPDGTRATPTITAAFGAEPSGIALDAFGKIYVVNLGNKNVTTYNPDGTQTTPRIAVAGNAGIASIAVH